MADLASLKIKVDSTEVRTADADLAAMSNSAGRTSTSMDKMIAANNRMSAALQTSNKATIDAVKYLNGLQYELETVGKSALQLKAIEIRMAAAKAPTVELQQEIRSLGAQLLMAERNAGKATGGSGTGITGLGNSSKLAAHHSQNLFFQLQDMFVGLTSGQKPTTVFIQQGSQIAGIMAQAQIGVMGVVRAIGSMIASVTMAVVTNPILMGIAAAAGAVALAFNFMADDISAASGVTVTAGDVMMGAFDVVRNFLSTQVTAAFAYFGTTAGEVWIGDNMVNDVEPKDRDVSMVFQSYALYPHKSVQANIEFPLKVRGVNKAERAEAAKQAAEVLGLTPYLERRPGALSGGQRQRVALARAIVRQPAVFCMDEPLSNLDAKLRAETRAELVALHDRLNATFVYVTHDQVEAMTMGNRIAVMRDGIIEQVGSPKEVYDEPASVFVAQFIGTPPMNIFPAGSVEAADHVVGARPEHTHLTSSGVAATVALVEHLGHEIQVVCTIDAEHRAIVRLPAGTDVPSNGSSVFLTADENHRHRFNVETGLRIS